MNGIDIDVNVTAWKIGPVIIMRGTATPTARVSHPECERLDRQEARG